MKRCGIMFVTVVVSVALMSAACVACAEDKVLTLRYADQMPAGDPTSLIAKAWCSEVEKRTNGRVRVRHYPGGTLSSPLQMYENVSKGVIDIGAHVLMYTPGRFPLMSLLYEYPIEYPSVSSVTGIVNEFYQKFRPKEFDEVKVLYFHCAPPAILLTRKPATRLDDLKGMKIRTMGQNAKVMSQLGAIGVGLPISEVYDAVSKGMIDGIVSPCVGMKEFRFAEVMKYALDYQGSAQVAVILVAMNKNKWNTIPPDVQKIIEGVDKEWPDKHAKVWEAMEKEARDYSINKGVKISKLSAEENAKWMAKASPLLNQYVVQMKQKNLPGEEALKFVRNLVKKGQ